MKPSVEVVRLGPTSSGPTKLRCHRCEKLHNWPSSNVAGFRCDHCGDQLWVPDRPLAYVFRESP